MIKVEPYVRGSRPALPESQLLYLQEELKKLEKTLASVLEAIATIDARLAALEAV